VPKRTHGEGSVFQRADGRWQASIQVDGVRRTVYGKTEKEARTRLLALKQQAASDEIVSVMASVAPIRQP
jgi:integrase